MDIKRSGLIYQQPSKLIKALPLAVAFAISGCGGGGGSDIIPPENGGGVTPTDPTNPTDPNTPDNSSAFFSSSKVMLADGTETNSFEVSGGVYEVILVDASGKAMPNQIVTYTSSNSSVIFANADGTVLTDSSGRARLAFSSNDPAINAAVTLTASANIDGRSIESVSNIAIKGEGVISTADPRISTAQVLVNNQPATSVSSAGGTFRAILQNGQNEPIANQIVNFTASSTDIKFGNSSQSVLTDSQGIAQLSFTPVNATISGAYALSASASVDGTRLSETVNISVQSTNIELSNLILGQTDLPSAGQTSVTVQTLNSTTKDPINGISVNFTSDCGVLSPATLASSGTGNVTVSYSAVKADDTLCAGPVNISASAVGGQNSSLTQQLNVAAAKPTQIEYPEGQSTVIGIKGSGSSSQATVKFVVYSDGTPLSGESITFNLSKAPKGTSIGELNNSADYKVITNDKGEAPINIYPGETPGPVEIKATVDRDTNISALSKGIAIANARASQKGISLSTESNNIQGWDRDGEPVKLSMRVADSQGNPVPNGTVVNFTAEGGQIQQSCETTKVNDVSLCTVNFVSQNPRPKDGRITIMAVLEGEKSYVDANQNNAFDANEILTTNIGNTFRDDDEDGQYDPGELIYLREGESAGSDACGTPSIIDEPNIADTCNGEIDALLREQMIMLFGSSTPALKEITYSPSGFVFKLNSVGPTDVSGKPNNPMPRNTKISASVKAVEGSKCKLQVQGGVKEIPDVIPTGFIATNSGNVPDLATSHSFSFAGCVPGDIAEVTIAVPTAKSTSFIFQYDGSTWK